VESFTSAVGRNTGTLETQMEKAILLRPGEAAALLSISKSKLYELIQSGEVPHTRVGNMLRIPRSVIERFAAQALRDNETDERGPQ
jgi:excisionase family DNA binding protein